MAGAAGAAGVGPPVGAPPPAGSLMRDRNFALLWTGQTISEFGSAVTALALPLIAVTVLHASAFEVAMVAAATSVAWLVVGLPAGAWVDRVRRRPVLITADLGRALALITVPAAWALGELTVAQLIVVAAVTGVLSVLANAAETVFLPAVIAASEPVKRAERAGDAAGIAYRDRLVDANGKLMASTSAAMIGGPSAGGALVQLAGAPAALLADAVSFVASAVCLSRIRVTERIPASESVTRAEQASDAVSLTAASTLRADLLAGLRYVLGHPFPRALATVGAVSNFVLGGYGAVLVLFLVREVGLASGLVGVLFALGAVGALAGSLFASRLAARYGDAVIIRVAPPVMAVAGLLVPLTRPGLGLAWYVVGEILMTACIAVFNVCVRAALQVGTPPDLLGRTGTSIRLFSRGALPLGALTAGTLATLLGARLTIAILMAVVFAVPIVLRRSPLARVRNVVELDAVPRWTSR